MREPITAAMITSTRAQLGALAINIAANIKPEALKDASAPVLWSNYGSYNAGKSLVAEMAASHLTGENVRGYFETEAGMFGFDSEFHSFRDNQNRQFQFCDIFFPWSGGLFGKRKQQQAGLLPKILDGQTKGGIIFVHNAPEAARKNGVDIEMNIRTRRKFSDFFNSHARQMPFFAGKSLKRLHLKRDYKSAVQSGDQEWVRLIELTIHNPEIFKPEFLDNFKNVQDLKALLNESIAESSNPTPPAL